MRFLLISTAILAAGPALAERIDTMARIDEVIVYPWGAGIGRVAELDLPQGTHELVIPNIPRDIDPGTLRVTAEGASIGAVRFEQDRTQPAEPVETPEFQAADAQVRQLERSLAQHDARAAEIAARTAAAEDMIAFLMALAESDTVGSDDFIGLTGAVRQQLVEARQTIASTEAEAGTHRQSREDLVEELDRAKTRREALQTPDPAEGALVVAVQGQGVPARIRITSLTRQANWQPVYDLALQRDAGSLRMDRGLLVTQNTGEDWHGVHMTLSTARPLDQSAPSELSPEFLRTLDDGGKVYSRAASAPDMLQSDEMRIYAEAAPVVEPVVIDSAIAGLVGETVIYDYPVPVDLRHSADSLRLPLDSHQLTPEVLAEAVPRRDDTAYLVADTVNSTGAVILPGEASFYADGALVGHGMLELTAAGDDMKLGFGPLTGIKLERQLPDESEGDRGLIVKSSERKETATLRIRNLTAEEWPLRIIDQVPVSRQDELRIDWSADPAPDETDPDGKRGLLLWNGPIAAGAEREITLTTSLRWPDGKRLIQDQ